MSVTLTANQCPTPPAFAGLLLTSATPPTSPTFVQGGRFGYTDVNKIGTRSDLNGRYGGGGYAIAKGLTLSFSGTLVLSIAAGHAQMDGVVEIGAQTLPLPNNQARIWIWLLQNTTVTYALTTAPPAGATCLLGSCVTSGGAITSVDTSGVLYLRGGALWRQTADNGQPIDTPPASLCFWARTNGGLFFWDGTKYTPVESYDLGSYVVGKPGAGAKVWLYVAARPFTIRASAPLSQGLAGVAATGSSVFSLQKNGVQFGTMTFAASGTVATFAVAADTAFAAGDLLSVVAPNPQDGTLADVAFTLAGVV